MRSSNRYPLRINLLIALASLVIFFLIVESAVRLRHWWKHGDPNIFFYGHKYPGQLWNSLKNPKQWFPDIDKIADGKPQLRRSKPYTKAYNSFTARLNEFGFRGPSISKVKPPNTIRITIHGGSFVFGFGVPDEATIPAILQTKLNASSTGFRYEVVNIGHGGEHISGVLRSFVREALPLKPDISIIISVYNNHGLFLENPRTFWWHVSNSLSNMSLFYLTLREKLSMIIYKDINAVYLPSGTVLLKRKTISKAIEYYRASLKKIATLAKENDVHLIFVLQPMFIPETDKDLQVFMNGTIMSEIEGDIDNGRPMARMKATYYAHSLLLKVMIDGAEQYDIPVVDCTKLFPHNKVDYFLDDIHPNTRGTPLVAEALFRHISSFIFPMD